MQECELCPDFNRHRPATVKITYGLYSAYKAGRPHHILHLCSECADALWNGTAGCVQPLKNIVTLGLCHFVVEKP